MSRNTALKQALASAQQAVANAEQAVVRSQQRLHRAHILIAIAASFAAFPLTMFFGGRLAWISPKHYTVEVQTDAYSMTKANCSRLIYTTFGHATEVVTGVAPGQATGGGAVSVETDPFVIGTETYRKLGLRLEPTVFHQWGENYSRMGRQITDPNWVTHTCLSTTEDATDRPNS